VKIKIYEVIFRLDSPTTVTSRRTTYGFLTFADHIPSSVLRGALLSSLYWRGCIDESRMLRESNDPEIIVSPAYPYASGRFYPSHPFVAECKKCKALCNEDYLFSYLHDALQKIIVGDEQSISEAFRVKCSRDHLALKHIHPYPVGIINGRLKKHEEHVEYNVAVGISKHRGTSMRGMLYGYEALAPGQEFWMSVMAPEDIKFDEGFEFWIGRGKSRGFGRARLVSVNMVDLEDRASELGEEIRGEKSMIFYANSPLAECNGHEYMPYPEEIDLGELLARFLDIKGSRAHLRIRRVIGKTASVWCGWDMRLNKPRPVIVASQQGSLVRAELEYDDAEEFSLALALLEYAGTIENLLGSPVAGFNMLSPVKAHPVYSWG